MKAFTLVALISASAGLANGQLFQNSTTLAFICPLSANAFCAWTSLTQNIIIRCNNGVGQPGNCNDNLAGVPPIGVKPNALCYESSPTAGDAACSVNGVVYGNNSTFTIALPSSTESLRPTEHWPGLPAYTPGPNTYTASSNANATTTSPTDASNTTDTPPVITSAGLVLFTGGAAANAAGGVMAAAGLVAAALL